MDTPACRATSVIVTIGTSAKLYRVRNLWQPKTLLRKRLRKRLRPFMMNHTRDRPGSSPQVDSCSSGNGKDDAR